MLKTVDTIDHLLPYWPAVSRKAGEQLVRKYRLPHEATDSMLVWYFNGPWKRTVLLKKGAPHNFPWIHLDILQQTIDYRVPPEKCTDLIQFNGSLAINRTQGEISACCDSEQANIAMLNIAHEIIIGRLSVPEAREAYAKIVRSIRFKWPDPYAEEFQFTPITSQHREQEAFDPDKSMSVFI